MATVIHSTYNRKNQDGLIVVSSEIDYDPIDLAFDTGASHTTIDLTRLLMIGYDMQDVVRTVQIETASGVIDTYVFRISKMTCLGITRKNIEISSYDFLAYGLFQNLMVYLDLIFWKISNFV